MITHSKPTIGTEEIDAVTRVLNSGNLNSGDTKKLLESRVAMDSGYQDAIAISSASIGIYLILKSRFPNGKAKIALSSYVCRSVWDAVVMANCIPILHDIDINTFAIDVTKIDIQNVDMVIVAHLFGIRAEFEYLAKNNVEVIEDCAQRITPIGINSEVRPAWRIYSFDPTKIITGGQGGIILGTNTNHTKAIRQMVNGDYELNTVCIKAPFTDIQASIALAQWNKLESFLETRKR